MGEIQTLHAHHVVNMTDCARLSLCGVREVTSFDESLVVLTTLCGILSVEGENLHVSRLDLEKGECDITGQITALLYTKARERLGFFGRRNNDR